MIPRRLAQHVKAQNWFAVGLDFVLVVAGVFIGIQMSNWNTALADQREQARLLTELAADVAADIDEIEGVRESAGVRIKAIEAALAAAGVETRPAFVESELRYIEDAEAMERYRALPEYRPVGPFDHHVALTQMRTLDGNRHTYTTLVSTNGFGLLRDRDLVRAIQGYYARVDEVRDLERFVAGQGNDARRQLQRVGVSRISRIDGDELRAKIRGAPELAAALGDFQFSSFNQWEAMFALRRQARSLLERLQPPRRAAWPRPRPRTRTTTMASDYTPIDCGLYDHLELHAMRGSRLDVTHGTPEDAEEHLEDVRLITIRQRSGEEFAIFEGSTASPVEIRLDHLRVLVDRHTGGRLVLGAAKDC